MKKISVILPVYNEEEVIADFHLALTSVIGTLPYEFEVIYVVDKCRDNTLGVLREAVSGFSNTTVIALSRRFGHQMSLVAGMDHCHSDAVIMMDSDLQHPPAVLPLLLEKFEEGYDIVHTRRRDAGGTSLLKSSSSRLFYGLAGVVSDVDLAVSAADFRLISAKVLEQFQQNIREQNQFLRGLFHWVGFKQTHVEFTADDRPRGRSKYNLAKLLSFAATGLTSFSKVPLRISTYIGLLLSFFTLLYSLFVVATYLTTDSMPPGWASLALLVSFVSGIQLIALGILGEYVGTIFDEVKKRPLYIVEDRFKGTEHENQ